MKSKSLVKSLILQTLAVFTFIFILLGGFTALSFFQEFNKLSFNTNQEYVRTYSTSIGNTMSVIMQQLRSYTMLDDIGKNSTNPYEIQEMLFKKYDSKFKYFVNLGYVSYYDERLYLDNGTIRSVSLEPWFIQMKSQRTPKKGLQLYGDISGETIIPVCKDTEPKDENGMCLGFFVGFCTVDYLKSLVCKAKDGDISKSFTCVVSSNGDIIAMPQSDKNVKSAFALFDNINPELKSFIKMNKKQKKENSSNLFSSEEIIDGKKYTVHYKSCADLWTVLVCIPEEESIKGALGLLKKSWVLALGLILGICVFGFVIKRKTKGLKTLESSFKNISSGDADLTLRLETDSKDEIGNVQGSFNSFLELLQSALREVSNNLYNLKSSFENMKDATNKSSEKTNAIDSSVSSLSSFQNDVNNSILNMNASIEKMQSALENLSNTSKSQNNSVEEASAAVEEIVGNILSVNSLTLKMNEVFQATSFLNKDSLEKCKTVSALSEEISKLSKGLEETNKVISSIASQTNLLSMNAAIEAAHAGQAGLGFAVVADEIRKLAEDSSAQSKGIKKFIEEILKLIQNIVDASKITSESNQLSFEKLNETSELVSQIKTAMEEQSSGGEQVLELLKSLKDQTDFLDKNIFTVRSSSYEVLNEVKKVNVNVENTNESIQAIKNDISDINICSMDIEKTSEVTSDSLNNTLESIHNFKF